MHPILKNILAVVAGWFGGGIVNMGILYIGQKFRPLPEGTDPMDPVSLSAAMETFTFVDYLIPLLAHALGTAAAAYFATKVAASHKFIFAMAMGLLFFAGGVWSVLQIDAPLWFNPTDLILAYFPMAYLWHSFAKTK